MVLAIILEKNIRVIWQPGKIEINWIKRNLRKIRKNIKIRIIRQLS